MVFSVHIQKPEKIPMMSSMRYCTYIITASWLS
jgi:hypothetical protein